MKILNLCFHDNAGAGYALSHAINKLSAHQAINLRSTRDFTEYPAIAEMKNYDAPSCRRMVEKADVVVFHSAVKPYYSGLGLTKKALQEKKKLLYFHGSEMRFYGKEILAQADDLMDQYQILVSTPEMLLTCSKPAKWLPVARSFQEIQGLYSRCNQDTQALEAFAEPKVKTVFCHAPSDEAKKGSNMFYAVLTRLMRELPNVAFLTIHNQPWTACLSLLSTADVYLDQNPPFDICSYGLVSVEASIFKLPVITKMHGEVIDLIKKETGLDSPFITFTSEDDLTAKLYLLAQDADLRRTFGAKTYRYCRKVHDEKPVVDHFLEIIEGMN